MKIQNLLIPLALGGLILTGCSPTYNIVPDYNKKTKTIIIDDYKINQVYFYKKTTAPIARSMGKAGKDYTLIKTDSNNCKYIKSHHSYRNGGWRNSHSALDKVLSNNRNDCQITKIGNLHFIKCKKETYRITSSDTDALPYGDIKMLAIDKKCFNSLKAHFSKKTKPKYIEEILIED